MRIPDKFRLCLKLKTMFLDLANQIAMSLQRGQEEEEKKMMKSNTRKTKEIASLTMFECKVYHREYV